MSSWKKVAIALIIVFVVGAIVAIVAPIELSTRRGEESEWMWAEDMEFTETDKKTGEVSVKYAAGTLRKEPGKDFVILNFADTQLYLPTDIAKTGMIYKTMKKAVEQAKPDLITIAGDLAWFPPTRQSYAQIAKVLDGFGIPWTFVFGNHDHEGNSDRNYLIEVMQKSKYCIIDKGPRNVAGVGNSFINIVERQPNGKDKIVHTVILLDSGDSGYDYTKEQTTYDYDYITKDDIKEIKVNAASEAMKAALKDCTMDFDRYPYLEEIHPDLDEYEDENIEIDEDDESVIKRVKVGKTYAAIDYTQIAWYEWVLKGNMEYNILNGFTDDPMPKSTCIFHIALNEFYDAYKQWLLAIRDNDVDAVNAMQAEGRMRMDEIMGSATLNTGFFAKMKELGSTENVIVGHDHVNDFSLVYEGIRLTYSVKTGSKCYWEKDGTMNGGTKLSIGDNKTELKQIYIDDYVGKLSTKLTGWLQGN